MSDVVFRNGAVWTGLPGAVATAVAVRSGRIVAAGSDDEITALSGPTTTVVDLAGRTLAPGLIDAHTHFLSGGLQLSGVKLRDAHSRGDFRERIRSYAGKLPAGTWITGGEWDHEMWGGSLPTRAWVDDVSPDHPVFVQRLDLHMALANTRALEVAGVDAGAGGTPDPAGGSIVRDPQSGEATGVLKDEAMKLVGRVIPEATDADLDLALAAASEYALSLGLTQVHDMGSLTRPGLSWTQLDAYRRARAGGRLPLRVYAAVPMSDHERLAQFISEHGRGDRRLWWGAVKAFVDGSLGSSTAWFQQPYADEPATSGLTVTDLGELGSWIEASDEAGLHVIVHAIGDRANDWLLESYARVAAQNGPRDRRFRIEHAQHLSRRALPCFGAQGVIASMQPYHAADDGRWAARRLGKERLEGAFRWRSLLDAGARVAFGSDWTVAPLDPLTGIDAAVNRRTLDGAHPSGWTPQERVSLKQALSGYTSGAAYSGYCEDRVGTIAEGKLADLVVFSENIFDLNPSELSDVQVDMTVVEGEIVFERDSVSPGVKN
jgi:predicted amidohydrolase YtcJ